MKRERLCLWSFLSNFSHSKTERDFPGGPVVKNPPYNAGDAGSIPGRGTKIPHAAGQLSLPASARAHVSQSTEPTLSGARAPQLERENPHATTKEKPVGCNEEPTPQGRSRMPQLRPDAAKKKKERKKEKNKNKKTEKGLKVPWCGKQCDTGMGRDLQK